MITVCGQVKCVDSSTWVIACESSHVCGLGWKHMWEMGVPGKKGATFQDSSAIASLIGCF